MAIDTAERRRAAASITTLPFGPGVTPNALKGSEWRQQVGRGYSGFAAGEPSEPEPALEGSAQFALSLGIYG